jgi:Calcium-activated chloride channel
MVKLKLFFLIEDAEKPRHQFKLNASEDERHHVDLVRGTKKRIQRGEEVTMNRLWYLGRRCCSVIVTGFFMICVGVCTYVLYCHKANMQDFIANVLGPSSILQPYEASYGNIAVSIFNCAQIFVFKYTYSIISEKLNDWENHYTQTIYEDFLISKTVLFDFVNSYFFLFYIAFIAGHFFRNKINPFPSFNCFLLLKTL